MRFARITDLLIVLSLIVMSGVAAQPAVAQPSGVVLWDQHIATAMNEALLSDGVCRHNPYTIGQPHCSSRQFDFSISRPITYYTHTLDRMAIFVDRIKDIDVDTEIEPGTEIKLRARLANIYRYEASVRVALEIEF